MHLEISCRIRRIDLEQNIRDGKLLSIEDVEYIIGQCRLPLDRLVRNFDAELILQTSDPELKSPAASLFFLIR